MKKENQLKTLTLVPGDDLRIAIEREQQAISESTGLRPSLSATACALIRRALATQPGKEAPAS